jgi:hypothetical protein
VALQMLRQNLNDLPPHAVGAQEAWMVLRDWVRQAAEQAFANRGTKRRVG